MGSEGPNTALPLHTASSLLRERNAKSTGPGQGTISASSDAVGWRGDQNRLGRRPCCRARKLAKTMYVMVAVSVVLAHDLDNRKKPTPNHRKWEDLAGAKETVNYHHLRQESQIVTVARPRRARSPKCTQAASAYRQLGLFLQRFATTRSASSIHFTRRKTN